MNFSYLITSVNSVSSFVNQQYVDQTNDWELIPSSTGTFRLPSPDGNWTTFIAESNKGKCKIDDYLDIKGVSYNSDGKTVYATLWINPISINQSASMGQVRNSWLSGGYHMSIDIPSVYDRGTDYIYRTEWNPHNQTWSHTLEERNIGKGGKNRILDLISNREGFFDTNSTYITFPLNGSMLSLPDRYKIIFSTWGAFQNDEDHLCATTDTTSFIDIPPPIFNLSISDLPPNIRKGETINVPIHLSSDSGINSQAILKAAYNNNSIALDIIPGKVNIPPYSVADSLLEISALDSKYPAQVRVNASISFPSSPVLQSGAILSIPSINNISEEVRFSLGILPELGLYDYVKNTLNTWGAAASEAIALMAGLGGAVTAIALIITKLRGQEKQGGNEENS